MNWSVDPEPNNDELWWLLAMLMVSVLFGVLN